MVSVEEKKAATDALIVEMGIQRLAAEKQQEVANIEADKASIASENARVIEVEAEKELSEAKPAMERASAAVDCDHARG